MSRTVISKSSQIYQVPSVVSESESAICDIIIISEEISATQTI
jgi:hypothetical protein